MTLHRIIFAWAAAACIGTAGWAAGFVAVDQKGLSFGTDRLIVAKGSVVAFLNSDATSHNILIKGGNFNVNSGLQRPGVTFKAPLHQTGTYQVSCGIHPKMKMTVVVR